MWVQEIYCSIKSRTRCATDFIGGTIALGVTETKFPDEINNHPLKTGVLTLGLENKKFPFLTRGLLFFCDLVYTFKVGKFKRVKIELKLFFLPFIVI
jgi:hypothetical protein